MSESDCCKRTIPEPLVRIQRVSRSREVTSVICVENRGGLLDKRGVIFHVRKYIVLTVIGKTNREVKLRFTDEFHDVLELVFFSTDDSYGFTLNLGFYFRI